MLAPELEPGTTVRKRNHVLRRPLGVDLPVCRLLLNRHTASAYVEMYLVYRVALTSQIKVAVPESPYVNVSHLSFAGLSHRFLFLTSQDDYHVRKMVSHCLEPTPQPIFTSTISCRPEGLHLWRRTEAEGACR